MPDSTYLLAAGWLPVAAIFAGMAAFVLVIIATAVLAERKRVQAFQGVANELGLAWHAAGQPEVEAAVRTFSLFEQGRGHKIYNLIHGQTEEAEVALFDFNVTTGSGDSETTHKRTMAWIRSPRLNLPQFSLRPEHFLHRVGKLMGMQDINFEEFPKFSKKYMLQGPDEAVIRAAFQPQLIARLEELPYAQLEGRGDCLALLTSNTRRRPRELPKLLEDAFEMFTLLRT